MKFSSILALSAAFGFVLSATFQLPGLPDGTYLLSFDESGTQIWADITANKTDSAVTKRDAASSNSRIQKRFIWPSETYPWCPGGEWLLENDFYNHGWGAFYQECYDNGNYKFPAETALANYQGNSVSYMCAYTANPCNADEWEAAVDWASSNCLGRSDGWMEPAYLHVPAWNKRYGYARDTDSIC